MPGKNEMASEADLPDDTSGVKNRVLKATALRLPATHTDTLRAHALRTHTHAARLV